MKNCLYLRLTVAFALAQSAAACGALRYSHSAYKTVPVAAPKPGAETAREHFLNLAFSFLLVATVVGLWIHFR